MTNTMGTGSRGDILKHPGNCGTAVHNTEDGLGGGGKAGLTWWKEGR